MKGFLQLFNEEQSEISKRINNEPTPEATIGVIRDSLDSLLAKYQKDEKHSSTQNDLAVQVINLMKASTSVLVAACETKIWKQSQSITSEQLNSGAMPKGSITNVIVRALQIILIIGILALFWLEKAFIYFCIIVGLVVLELARTVFSFFNKHNEKLIEKGYKKFFFEETHKLKATVYVRTDLLLSKLANAFLVADKFLELVTVNKLIIAENGLEKDSDMLDLFLDLLEAKYCQDAEYAMKKIKSIPYHLSRYEIEMEDFNGKNENFFEFQPSLNPEIKTYRTLRPALLKEKKLLKRGLVEEPN